MDTSNENRTTPVVADVRRQSDHGVLRASTQNATGQRDTKRRKTLSGSLPRSSSVEDSNNQLDPDKFPQEEEVVISPPRKTPSKHRISLGSAHAYYFKSTSKTPFQKDTSFQELNGSISQHAGDVTANAAELSFLSLAGSTGSSSTGNDPLNQSVLSDTTELTASNFILASSSRQRLAEFSKLAAERKQSNGKKDNAVPQGTGFRDGTEEPCLPHAATTSTPSDQIVIETLRFERASRGCIGDIASQLDVKKDTIDVRRMSIGTASALRQVPSPVATGRKSWHGTPGSIDVESSVMKYRELAATMKQVRLARDQQRQDEIKTRLSSMSNVSRMTERSDLVSNTSFLSTPSESSSSGSRDGIDTDLSRKIDVSDVGSRSLDELFEGLVPTSATRSFSSASGKVIRASDSTERGDNERSISDKSGYAVPDGSGTICSKRSISSKATLPLKPTSAQKVLTPTKLSASPRRVANPLSTDSPARNTRSASKHGLDTSALSQDSAEIATTPNREVETSVLSPFKARSAQKVLTPTKLSASPRRVANPLSTDSPARNTRSASKHGLDTSAMSQSSAKDGMSPGPSKEGVHSGSDVTPSRSTKVDSSWRNDLSEEIYASMGSKQRRTSILNSSLRKQGSARKGGNIVRHVEFGSPEFVEFNKSSPSMNLTPMPATKLRAVEALPEDTVEIEADMNALLNGVPPLSSYHVSSPSIGKNAQESACDMSLESISESKEHETVQLEMDMEDLLHDPSIEKHGPFKDKSNDDLYPSAKEIGYENPGNSIDIDEICVGDGDVTKHNTVSLEANMSELLKNDADTSDDKSATEISHALTSSLVHDISEDAQKETSTRRGIVLEEENTVELEMDMSALLMATEFDPEVSMNASPRTLGNRRRRSSISSRRFSLAPESRLSLSTDGQIIIGIIGTQDEENGAESLTELNESTPTSMEAPLTWKDVFSVLSINIEKAPPSSDFLEEVTRLLLDVEYGITLNAVFSQVVDHIEETTDPSLDDDNMPILSDLQHAIKTGKKDKYEMLAHRVQATELKKWTNWLVSVADTLVGPLKDLCMEYSQKSRVIDDNCAWIQESHHVLSSLEQQAAMRARKRSFSQRKQLVDKLETEVDNLKDELTKAQEIFHKANNRYILSVDVTNEVAKKRALVERRDVLQPRAENLARKYSYAKGLHRWKAPVISESELSFHYIGPTTDACVVLTFTVSKLGDVKCMAKSFNAITGSCPGSLQCLRVPLLTPFFKGRTAALCNEWSGKVLSDTSQICEVLRHFQWQMGRLEQTAMELLVLRRRHGAILTSSSDYFPTFKVEVDFSGTPAKLSASFELTAEYPFAPLNVILNTFEGSVDIEKIRTLLIKNAKPGFGYLSRTCDVISASVR